MKVSKMTFALLLIPAGLDPFTKKAPLYGYFSHFVPMKKECEIWQRISEEAKNLIVNMYSDEEANIGQYQPSIRTIRDYSPYQGKTAWIIKFVLDNVTSENGRVDILNANIVSEEAIGFKKINVEETMMMWDDVVMD